MDEKRLVDGTTALAEKQARVIKIEPTERPQNVRLRVAAYTRVSSDSEDQLNSFAAQNRYYTELISSKAEWRMVEIYADEGITGTSVAKRNDFQRMMADCRRGLIDQILVKSISRFARNTKDCLQNIRELKELGVNVRFEREGIDTVNVSSELITAHQENIPGIQGGLLCRKPGDVGFHAAEAGCHQGSGKISPAALPTQECGHLRVIPQLTQDGDNGCGAVLPALKIQPLRKPLNQLLFQLFRQIEAVPVVLIEGAPVDLGQITDLPNRNPLHRLLLQQRKKGIPDHLPGIAGTKISFHISVPFVNIFFIFVDFINTGLKSDDCDSSSFLL